MVSVYVSDNSWVRKPCCSDIYGLSVRVRRGEGVKVVIVGGIRKGVPEWGSCQTSPIIFKRVISVNPFGFNGVVVTVLIDVELDVMGFLHASPRHRDVHFVSDVGGIVGVITLVSQGYWEFGV